MAEIYDGPYEPSDDEIERYPGEAIDWLLAVRKYGLEEANRMFPEG